jgi:PIN domain nuclease of toxin-antitoxin system
LLQSSVRDAIEDPGNVAFMSAVTVWEVAIKVAAGKLKAPDLLDAARRTGLEELVVRGVHGVRAAELPRIHGDPFDRMLVAQAIEEGLTIVTSGHAIRRYPVATLRA